MSEERYSSIKPGGMEKFFTPKQVGLALGVSESSVKRWCDIGRVRFAKTAGGHRKVPLSAVVQLVRETGRELARPELVGLVPRFDKVEPAATRDECYAALIAGDESVCREMLLGYYQRGYSIVDLGDELIGPVMRRVGDHWESEAIRVHHERRASEIVMASLHELRQWTPAPPADAPLALCATPMQDFAEIPIRLVELTLRESGWNTAMAGSGLPLEEIVAAIDTRAPQVVCLSLTHLNDVDDYVERHNKAFGGPTLAGVRLVVGGGVCQPKHAERLRCDRFAARLADLTAYLATLPGKAPATPPEEGEA